MHDYLKAKSLVLGVDPGLTGCLALLELKSQRLEALIDIPLKAKKPKKRGTEADLNKLAVTLDAYSPYIAFAVVEQVHAMPGQGVSSTFTFGRNSGQLEGLIAASFIPFFPVTPQTWKKAMHLSADKAESLELAKRVFENQAQKFTRKMDHNRAEAALIALYGEIYLKDVYQALVASSDGTRV